MLFRSELLGTGITHHTPSFRVPFSADRACQLALISTRKRGGIGSGRKSALTPDKIDTARKLLAAGDKPAKVARLLKVGLSTFYRHFPASERADKTDAG